MPGPACRFSPERVERIIRALSLGATRTLAAQAGGIGRQTLYDWLNRGRAGQEPYVAFVARVDEAESRSAERALATIQLAAKGGQWQAAAWLLERRHGYVRTERREVAADVNVDAGLPTSGEALAELRAALELVEAEESEP